MRILRRHEEGARQHLPAALHHDLEERVLAASGYPAEDRIPLTRAVAPRDYANPVDGAPECAWSVRWRE